jgi:general secretion pathway protein F
VPRFRYRALRPTGGEIAGELLAADERDAATRLQAQGSYPIEITAPDGRGPPALRLARNAGRLPPRELILFTRQLAALVGAGVPLDRALSLIGSGRGRVAGRNLAADLLIAINRGESLSHACANQPRLPRHYAMIVAAGEARGDVGDALDRLGDILERSRATSRALLDALIYPASVLVVAAASTAFLLGFVLPRFEVLLDSFQREPPLAMRYLMALSVLFRQSVLPFAVALAGLLLFVAVRYRDLAFRLAVHHRLLRLPGIGPLIGKLEAERMLYLLGNLVAAGVELRAAIGVTRDAMTSEAFRAGLALTERGIERGDGIAAALEASGTLPGLAAELVRTGEETGDVAPMLLKAGDLLGREFEATSRELIGIVTPISIVLLGMLIGAVAAAVLSTVMEVNDLAL